MFLKCEGDLQLASYKIQRLREGIATSFFQTFWSGCSSLERGSRRRELYTHPRPPLQQLLLANYCESDRQMVQCQPNAAHCLFRAQWRVRPFTRTPASVFNRILFENACYTYHFFLFNELVSVVPLLFRLTLRQRRRQWKARRGGKQNQVHRQCFFCIINYCVCYNIYIYGVCV